MPRKGKDAALGRWVKWQRWNRTLLDRGESSVLTKRKIKLLNSIGFSWGYQRVPPQKKTSTESSSSDIDVTIEPLPYMPSETVASTSTKPNARHVVSPPFSASSLQNHVTNNLRDDRASFSSRYGEPNNFFNHQVNHTHTSNHHQINFVRPSMSPFEDESDNFDRQDTDLSNAFEYSQFQGYNMDPMSNHNFQGVHGSRDFTQMMNGSFKINSDEMFIGRHVATSKRWKCSVCRYASFDTFDEALTHENSCNGLAEGSFCRACAA